ncbi:MAG TPA: hypothetical protein VGW75_01480 [Solirubrobacteraceae bacterium]|jgi:uncharacterized protein YkwD|nr:hypothetical protein [Solirubrobacteraceae bacterium]
MDTFSAIVFISIVVVFGTFVLLGSLANRRHVADITDKKRNRALGAQAAIEDADLPQMVDATNEYRRKQGMPEVTLEEVRSKVGAEQLAILDQADREARQKSKRRTRLTRERRGF